MDIVTIVVLILCTIVVIIAFSNDTRGWDFLSRLVFYALLSTPAISYILCSIFIWG